MNVSTSSLNYVTFLFGLIRLLIAFYIFFLVGIKRQNSIYLPYRGYHRTFLFFLGLWSLIMAVYFLYPGTVLLPRILSLVYVVLPFISLTYFYFCFTYTFHKKIHWMKHLLWLMVIPLVTAILSIVPDYNQYFVIFTTDITYIPYRDIKELYKPWFYVHSAYSYALVLAGIIFLMIKAKHPSTQDRKLCIYAIIASALYILQNVYRTFFKGDNAIWFTPLFTVSVATIFFIVVYADEGQILVDKGQEKLMQTMLFPIFFLNKDKKIVLANEEAFRVCPNTHRDFEITGYFQDIMDNFSPYKIDTKLIRSELFADEEQLILQSKADGSIFYLHQQNIAIRGKMQYDEAGTLLMLVAISSMQHFLSTLEDKAFRDPLCGCYNRHFLEIKQAEFSLETDEQNKLLPISFIMCDIDGLKAVNDTYGHDKGNEYITLCHEVMRSSLHAEDYIFRLGGDEFLAILTNTERQVVQERVKTIESKMKTIKKEYHTSISLGSATAEKPPIDSAQLIKEADKEMYQKKAQRKNRL